MTDEEMAEEYAKTSANCYKDFLVDIDDKSVLEEGIADAFLAGLKAKTQWHKIFGDKEPPKYDLYFYLPQDTLPKTLNYYFVKLKNGYIKVCELKYDLTGKTKCFYDLHGCKQTNVAEWLDYPTA